MDVSPQMLEAEWPLTEVHGIKEYPGHDACELSARQGKYVLKLCGDWVGKEDVQRSTSACVFLRKRGFANGPRIIGTRHGSYFRRIGHRFAYLYEYILGTLAETNIDNCRELGLIAGKLHSLTDFPLACPICVNSLKPEMLAYADEVPFEPEYRQLVESLPSLDGLPAGLIHADLSLGNTLERPNGELMVLDWDEAGTGSRILDLGYPLIGAFLHEDLKFDLPMARAFYSSYQSVIRLTEAERAGLFSAALFYALWFVRFGDPDARWRRIQDALSRREELLAAVFSA